MYTATLDHCRGCQPYGDPTRQPDPFCDSTGWQRHHAILSYPNDHLKAGCDLERRKCREPRSRHHRAIVDRAYVPAIATRSLWAKWLNAKLQGSNAARANRLDSFHFDAFSDESARSLLATLLLCGLAWTSFCRFASHQIARYIHPQEKSFYSYTFLYPLDSYGYRSMRIKPYLLEDKPYYVNLLWRFMRSFLGDSNHNKMIAACFFQRLRREAIDSVIPQCQVKNQTKSTP